MFRLGLCRRLGARRLTPQGTTPIVTTLSLVDHLDPEDRPAHLAAILGEVGRRVRASNVTTQEARKRCPRCQETKPLTAFGLHSSRSDGRQAICRICRSAPPKS